MKLHALLLAAGKSQRFNNIKQLANVSGRPMICHCLAQYYESGNLISGIDQLTVVLGANSEKIKSVLSLAIVTFKSHHWESGMGSSISDAIQAIPKQTTHVLVGLADQVAVDQAGLKRLIEAYGGRPNKIIASHYRGKVGAPAIFPRAYFAHLTKLSGDQGAKRLLQTKIADLHKVDFPEAAMDVDTPEDLSEYLLGKQPTL